MRFMVMHKVDAAHEAGAPPPPRVIEEMGVFVQKLISDGVMLDGAGLHRSAMRARVEARGGASKITKGPYKGSNELLQSFAMIEADSLDDAAAIVARAAAAAGEHEIEIEVGKVVEPWDLGVAPEPEGISPRFLVLVKGDAASERGEPPVVQEKVMRALAEDHPIAPAALTPSKQGARSKVVDGKRTWTDGPFTEARELVGGYCIVELPSIDDVKRLADRYAEILGDNEIDIRVLA
jgi:hypothetical protein